MLWDVCDDLDHLHKGLSHSLDRKYFCAIIFSVCILRMCMPMTESDQRYYNIRAGSGILSINFVFSGKVSILKANLVLIS